MRYRRFGKTNLQIPVISCGGMRYQAKWGDIKPEDVPAEGQKNLEATIRRAVDLGINHIETARGYGSSEMQLGYVLPSIPRDKLIVQTKVAPVADTKKFLDAFDTSMNYLKLDYVDLFSLHGINDKQTLDWAIRPGGCLHAARKLQKQGLCRHIGFSTHALLDDILTALKHEEDGGFDYVNLHWYYISQRNWPAVQEAAKRDIGVFIISPSDKGGKLYAPPEKLTKLCEPVHPIIFNDLYCLDRPEVHTLSVGAARPSDFDLHVQAVDMMDKTKDIVPPIVAKLEAAMKAAVGATHPEDFNTGLPEFHNVPGDMNLRVMVWLRNLAMGWDMQDYGKMRYNLLGNGGHWFPGKNAVDIDKLANDVQKAVAGTPYADKIVPMVREAHALLGGQAVKRQSQS